MFRAGEAYDARVRSPNRKFLLTTSRTSIRFALTPPVHLNSRAQPMIFENLHAKFLKFLGQPGSLGSPGGF